MIRQPHRAPVHILTSISELRALADPLRFRIFEHLTSTRRTPKQMATVLGTKPTRLYHHFRVLERAGLIRPVARRRKRGTVECYYEAVARRVAIDPALFGKCAVPIRSVYATVLRATLDEIAARESVKGARTREETLLVRRLHLRLTPAQARSLRKRLLEWIAACQAASEDGQGREYGVTVAFYQLDTSPSGRRTQA